MRWRASAACCGRFNSTTDIVVLTCGIYAPERASPVVVPHDPGAVLALSNLG
jgi:hypothetical protein